MDGKGFRSSWLLIFLGIIIAASALRLLNHRMRPLPILAVATADMASNQRYLADQTNRFPKFATNSRPTAALIGDTNAIAPTNAVAALTETNPAPTIGAAKEPLSQRSVASLYAGPPPYRVVHILCIGISDYPGEWADLPYGEKDAKDFSNALSKTFGSSIEIHGPLLGERATKANILVELDAIRSAPGDDVIIFYSGHGATLEMTNTSVGSISRHDRFGFLVPHDPSLRPTASFGDYTNKALDMRLFIERFRRIPARHRICLIDSCFSASGIAFVNPRNKVPNDRVVDLLGKPTVQVITTGAEMEEAPARPVGAENSLLTHALIEVLKSGGIQTGDEVYFQVRQMVREMATKSSFRLNPQRRYLEESSGDFVFIPPSKRNQWSDEVLVADAAANKKGYYRAVSEDEVAKARAASESGGGENDPNWSGEIDRLETRASMGDANAAAALVHLYGRGVGTKADGRQAYVFARVAYDTQLPAGRYALGVAFANGFGVRQSETESKVLWGLAGAQMLTRFGLHGNLISGLPVGGLPGIPGGGMPPGPANLGEAAGMASFFMNVFRKRSDGSTATPEEYGRKIQRRMDDRRKKIQERISKAEPDWVGAEAEIEAWKNEVTNLKANLTADPIAMQFEPQLQELQDILLNELRELKGNVRDRLKTTTLRTLTRVQEKLGTLQMNNQQK